MPGFSLMQAYLNSLFSRVLTLHIPAMSYVEGNLNKEQMSTLFAGCVLMINGKQPIE